MSDLAGRLRLAATSALVPLGAVVVALLVGAGEEIHRLLLDYRARGGAVLLVSYEISELRALADRVLVMLDGAVTADLDAADATEEVLGAAMASGARPEGQS